MTCNVLSMLRINLLAVLVVAFLPGCQDLSVPMSLESRLDADPDFQTLISIHSRIEEVADQHQALPLWTELTHAVERLDERYVQTLSPSERLEFKALIRSSLNQTPEDRIPLPIRQFQSEHVITASISEVWHALVDVASFPAWNPFTPRVETTFDIGSPIVMWVRLFRIFPDNLSKVTETVTDFAVEDRMCWESVFGSAFWMRTYRCYVVGEITPDETILRSTMVYEGLLAPLVEAFSRNLVMDGFNDVADAMEVYLE